MLEVSIIVPVYNTINYLDECLQSIGNQIYKSYELLLVDDGSPDNSGIVLDQYAFDDSRIVCIHKPNGGVSSARNTGIELSVGCYLTFIDSDDYVLPEYLSKLVATQKQNPEIEQVICGFSIVSDGKIKKEIIASPTDKNTIYAYNRKKYMFYCNSFLSEGPCCKLYHNSIIKKNNIHMNCRLSLGEDWLFNLYYMDAQTNDNVIAINKPLYMYRTVDSSLSNGYRSDYMESNMLVFDKLFELLGKWECDSEQFQMYYNDLFSIMESGLSNTMSPQNKQSKREKFMYNNRILKSSKFKEALRKNNKPFHFIYKVSYYLNLYQISYYFNQIRLLIRRRIIKT